MASYQMSFDVPAKSGESVDRDSQFVLRVLVHLFSDAPERFVGADEKVALRTDNR